MITIKEILNPIMDSYPIKVEFIDIIYILIVVISVGLFFNAFL